MLHKISRQAVVSTLIIAVSFSILVSTFNSCSSNNAVNNVTDTLIAGRQLAQKYCVSCHQFSEPSLLDKKTWEQGVLPAMAQQLKVHSYMGQYFSDNNSTLSTSDWQTIVAYYRKAAPAALVIPKSSAVKDWAIFAVNRPRNVYASGSPAMTTFIGVNPYDRQLYTADAANHIFRWDNNLNAKLLQTLKSPVAGISFSDNKSKVNEAVVTCIGMMAPVDNPKGEVVQLDLNNKKSKQTILSDSLPRPVQTVSADFNKDGLPDYVTCGFGHDRGALYLLLQQANHQYKKSIMRGTPGGTQLITGDFNNDGYADVICLFSQADEGIWMFLNDQKGGFTSQNLLHFPPIYGSSSFQLVDFNHDGKLDILYTCGDNSDYSKVLKPYHGIYIFTNTGNWKFKQTYFYHVDGCTKAIAADFTKNGKLDIASIAFFADFKFHPTEGFTYLEATTEGKFKAHEVPVNLYGRWITMDVNDLNGDGYPDVILGNFSIGARGLINQKGFKPDWDMYEPLIVLKNTTGKK